MSSGGNIPVKLLDACSEFPNAPVFHAQPVSSAKTQYGALNATPRSALPQVRSAPNAYCQPLFWEVYMATHVYMRLTQLLGKISCQMSGIQ